ncbi:MAG: XdhC family protein [Verrucomicrobiales bacterium]|nr:XdhC family protein [Verrucomicrobiales bacterium]
MNELQSILQEWRRLGVTAETSVLATVVQVRGSSYRRPGARMLLLPNGRRVGTISGGCLEGDVARKAAWWTSQGLGVVRTFDNSAPDVAWEFGLGCNGVISILLERVASPGVRESLEFIEARQSAETPCAIATVIRTGDGTPWRIGDRWFRDAEGDAGGSLSGSPLAAAVSDAMQTTLEEEAGRLFHSPEADVFIEWIGLPQRLVVFGGGLDVVPLARMAAILGWRVTVVDAHSGPASSGRFPGVERVVPLPDGDDLSSLGIDERAAVVLMTHNYPRDRALLPRILECHPRYLGLLGPHHRAESLFRDAGVEPGSCDIHAPVGLDLGADHPETIALSIVAEIQSVLAGRAGGSLRRRRGSLHVPVPECGCTDTALSAADEATTLEVCEAAA